jgi:hypothetical protein
MANVARRMRLSEGQFDSLRNALIDAPSTQRWRVVHLLGAFPTLENCSALLHSIDQDPDGSVKYGAARSLAEMASWGNLELRTRIIEEIKRRVEALGANTKIRDELARALVITPEAAPEGWGEVVAEVGRIFFQRADVPESRDRWRKYIVDAELRYGNRVSP